MPRLGDDQGGDHTIAWPGKVACVLSINLQADLPGERECLHDNAQVIRQHGGRVGILKDALDVQSTPQDTSLATGEVGVVTAARSLQSHEEQDAEC